MPVIACRWWIGRKATYMPDIKIYFKNGDVGEFKHQGRPGGSYTKVLTLDQGFVVITDEWSTRTIFPAADIERIVETPTRW